MNFGVVYGQSAETFQEKHKIPKNEAQRFIDWWWEYFGSVQEWKKEVIKQMRTGKVWTEFGRPRRFHLLTKENFNASVREAVNFLPQSTAADFTLCAVIMLVGGLTVKPEIDLARANIVLTVYDSILGDVEESYVDEYTTICKQVMESRPKDELGWTIPFKVDIGSGATWADAK
jgi:DNA polymerase I